MTRFGRDEIVARLGVLLTRHLSVGLDGERLEETTGLLGHGIGLDSVEVLQLVAAIEEDFGLTIRDDELAAEHFETVGAVARFIEVRLG